MCEHTDLPIDIHICMYATHFIYWKLSDPASPSSFNPLVVPVSSSLFNPLVVPVSSSLFNPPVVHLKDYTKNYPFCCVLRDRLCTNIQTYIQIYNSPCSISKFRGFSVGKGKLYNKPKKNHLQSFVYAMFVVHSWHTHLHHHCFFVCTFVVCNSVCSYIVCYAHQYASMCIHSILKALQMIFFFVCYRALPSQPKTHEISK